VVRYLEQKLHTKLYVPSFPHDPIQGIIGIDTSINLAVRDLRERKIGGFTFQYAVVPGEEDRASSGSVLRSSLPAWQISM